MSGEGSGGGGGRRLDDAQRLAWLRLIRSEGVGPRTFRSALNHFGGAAAALEGLPGLARAKGGRTIRICPRDDALRELEGCERLGVRLVALGEPDYPVALQAIDAPPPLLGVRGQGEVLLTPAAAIVGSRNASAGGIAMAQRLARGLGKAGFCVVSGLARGIDAAAHHASLSTGTVAVLAGGQDRIYPSEHDRLVEAILEIGAVVSEMPLGWEPRGRDFPRRNRLVSGLSLGVVVVEAARRSGSLITARFALEQGREVFAIPGSPLDPRAEGPNDLIREGATLTTDAADVVAALLPLAGGRRVEGDMRETAAPPEAPFWDELDLFGAGTTPLAEPDTAAPAPNSPDDSPADRIVALLGATPVAIDLLVRASGLDVPLVRGVLAELEMIGMVERHSNDTVVAARGRSR